MGDEVASMASTLSRVSIHGSEVDDGWTPLFEACQAGDEAAVRVQVQAGADVHARSRRRLGLVYKQSQDETPYGKMATPLHVAAFGGSAAVISALLEAGAKVNARDELGWTPVYISSYLGREAAVVALLEGRADVSIAESLKAKFTPLHAAVCKGHVCTTVALLNGGAIVDAKANFARTALDVAAKRGFEDCVDELLKHGADPNSQNSDGRTPSDVVKGNTERSQKILAKLKEARKGFRGSNATKPCMQGTSHQGTSQTHKGINTNVPEDEDVEDSDEFDFRPKKPQRTVQPGCNPAAGGIRGHAAAQGGANLVGAMALPQLSGAKGKAAAAAARKVNASVNPFGMLDDQGEVDDNGDEDDEE